MKDKMTDYGLSNLSSRLFRQTLSLEKKATKDVQDPTTKLWRRKEYATSVIRYQVFVELEHAQPTTLALLEGIIL